MLPNNRNTGTVVYKFIIQILFIVAMTLYRHFSWKFLFWNWTYTNYKILIYDCVWLYFTLLGGLHSTLHSLYLLQDSLLWCVRFQLVCRAIQTLSYYNLWFSINGIWRRNILMICKCDFYRVSECWSIYMYELPLSPIPHQVIVEIWTENKQFEKFVFNLGASGASVQIIWFLY